MRACGVVTHQWDSRALDAYGGTCTKSLGHDGAHNQDSLSCIHGRDPHWRCEICDELPDDVAPPFDGGPTGETQGEGT